MHNFTKCTQVLNTIGAGRERDRIGDNDGNDGRRTRRIRKKRDEERFRLDGKDALKSYMLTKKYLCTRIRHTQPTKKEKNCTHDERATLVRSRLCNAGPANAPRRKCAL